MKFKITKSNERGYADHGWLKANHSFSFANYYNPENIHFGVLRVLNEDIISASMGFGMHPHEDMEIITIPLSGSLMHKDSMGNSGKIQKGEVQVMSAGLGIKHSEYNASASADLHLLQIWIIPNQKNVTPRYDQIKYDIENEMNQWIQIVSPNENDAGSWIYQKAWLQLGKFTKDTCITYESKSAANGVYIFCINGNVSVDEYKLFQSDAIAISSIASKINLVFNEDTFLLILDVPMHN